MLKLLKYLKDYIKECIISPLFKMFEVTFELLVPFVVAVIIDKGIGTGDRGYIVKMVLLLVLFGIVGFICTVIAQYYAAKAAVGFSKKLRHSMFAHLQNLSFSNIDRLGVDTMITRMTSDINQAQTGVNLTLRLLLRSPSIVFGAMIMAFTIDVASAMVFVVVIPILFVIVFAIMIATIPLYKKVQQKLDGVLGKTRENLTGAREIRAFGIEDNEKAEFKARNAEFCTLQKRVGRISALMNPITFVIINLGIIFLIDKGALRVNDGVLTTGQVIALYNYMTQILIELIKLANLIITITRAFASGNRISAVLEIPGGEAAGAESYIGENTVEFRDVSLRYGNDAEDTLSNISFTANSGDVIGIIGGTGAGKSSLVNMIPAFYKATNGAVFVGGRDVKEFNPDSLRQIIGIVPQKAQLFKGTIRENICWGKADATDSEINEALSAAQALDVVRSKDNGLDSELEQSGRNLSGGQKQRLTIARAMVKKPPILILDDSSSALDYATDAALRKAIKSLPYKPTVFIVSQRTSAIQHADKILVLDDGNLVGCGTHNELLESCLVYKEIYDSQAER